MMVVAAVELARQPQRDGVGHAQEVEHEAGGYHEDIGHDLQRARVKVVAVSHRPH